MSSGYLKRSLRPLGVRKGDLRNRNQPSNNQICKRPRPQRRSIHSASFVELLLTPLSTFSFSLFFPYQDGRRPLFFLAFLLSFAASSSLTTRITAAKNGSSLTPYALAVLGVHGANKNNKRNRKQTTTKGTTNERTNEERGNELSRHG